MIGRVGEIVKTPRIWTYLGMLALAGGCVLLAVGWGLAAGKSEVALQVPYLLSAALPGVGLVVIAIGMVIIGVRETDAKARREQQKELAALMSVLRDELAAREIPAPALAARPRRSRKAVS
ncbi:MAG TPA: hypothetical protein VHW74_18090 [Mycobacteriales bacterium]|jgi:hypothetical protein|nr:hypothetical protein [Mycobacteriales bacterium]